MAIDKKREDHKQKVMAEASLMGDNPEKALLHKNKMEIYKKEKEALIRGDFSVEVVGPDGITVIHIYFTRVYFRGAWQISYIVAVNLHNMVVNLDAFNFCLISNLSSWLKQIQR